MSITNISKFETAMKENEDILNKEIDTNIDELRAEESSSTNKKFSPLYPNNSPSSYNQPSADIIK